MATVLEEIMSDVQSGVALKRIQDGMAALNVVKTAMATKQLPTLAPLLLAARDFAALAEEVAGMVNAPNPPQAGPPA